MLIGEDNHLGDYCIGRTLKNLFGVVQHRRVIVAVAHQKLETTVLSFLHSYPDDRREVGKICRYFIELEGVRFKDWIAGPDKKIALLRVFCC